MLDIRIVVYLRAGAPLADEIWDLIQGHPALMETPHVMVDYALLQPIPRGTEYTCYWWRLIAVPEETVDEISAHLEGIENQYYEDISFGIISEEDGGPLDSSTSKEG